MTIIYPTIFTQTNDAKDTYLIEIPDLNGFTEGHGMADAFRMARDYIGCTLYEMSDSDFPKASAIQDIDISKGEFYEDGAGIVTLIDVDIEAFRKKMETRAVRKNVSLPASLAHEAEKAHLNLSRVLQEALNERLGMA